MVADPFCELRASCDLCFKRKRACISTGDGPKCVLCTRKGVECNFSTRGKRGPKPKRRYSSEESGAEASLVAVTLASTPSPEPEAVKIPLAAQTPREVPLSKLARLSPSGATGLLGLQENTYLQMYCSCYAGIAWFTYEEIQRAVADVMAFQDPLGTAKARAHDGGGGQHALAKAADRSLLWVAVACGMMMQGVTDLERLEPFLTRARECIKECYDDASPQVLRAYLFLANVHATLEDYGRFQRYFGFAISLAQSSAAQQQRRRRQQRGKLCDDSAQEQEELSSDMWIVLEGLRIIKLMMDNVMDEKRAKTLEDGPPDADSSDASHSDATWIAQPESVVAGFVPTIAGLPSYEADTLQAVIEESRCMLGDKAQQLARHNATAAALTALADPDAVEVEALVSTATKGKTSILPTVMAVDLRLEQVIHMVHTWPQLLPRARSAGASLRLILERVCDSLGSAYTLRPGLLQFKFTTMSVFLALLAGDEEECLALLLQAHRMLREAPGLARFPAWRQDLHYTAALLLSAGMTRHYAEFSRLYNSLNLAGGTDKLPEDDAGKAAIWSGRSYHTTAVLRIVVENAAAPPAGGARIFVHNLDPSAARLPPVQQRQRRAIDQQHKGQPPPQPPPIPVCIPKPCPYPPPALLAPASGPDGALVDIDAVAKIDFIGASSGMSSSGFYASASTAGSSGGFTASVSASSSSSSAGAADSRAADSGGAGGSSGSGSAARAFIDGGVSVKGSRDSDSAISSGALSAPLAEVAMAAAAPSEPLVTGAMAGPLLLPSPWLTNPRGLSAAASHSAAAMTAAAAATSTAELWDGLAGGHHEAELLAALAAELGPIEFADACALTTNGSIASLGGGGFGAGDAHVNVGGDGDDGYGGGGNVGGTHRGPPPLLAPRQYSDDMDAGAATAAAAAAAGEDAAAFEMGQDMPYGAPNNGRFYSEYM